MLALISLETKSGKNKMYGLKWKKVQNVGTKSAFTPNMFTHYKKHYQHITLNINEKYQIKYAKFYCV